MNIILTSFSRLRGIHLLNRVPTANAAVNGTSHLRSFSDWLVSRSPPDRHISSQAEGAGVFRQLPWQYQQVRTRKRGIEYQPKNLKRKRTHGWIKRLSTRGGIEVILRRMLKGRKSLSH
ncbi:39S ribosomal protein L34, mitochondrial [Syngnathoides biaculeatus]|uniref:39S ribosomal protein L34, mitochondrial n=1 Tax=Syngnathoides biaculeatus TaxID=300417 RepID=UPI002ADE6BF6|nr:39S ribosomal protein L34, mitochondrial [Syngnathoides biaculeatus]